MKNAFKGLAVIVAGILFFIASLSAIKSVGSRRAVASDEKSENTDIEEDTNDSAETADTTPEGDDDMTDISTNFDEELISFLEKSGYSDKNYMVSPASFRAVLALAVAGADSDTKTSLIKAMGFVNEEEMNEWYNNVLFAPDTASGFITFKMLNSAWHNTASKGSINETYRQNIRQLYHADAEDVAPDKITDAVNDWVNEGTEGLVPKMSDDLSQVDMVLANTIYLKSSWVENFEKMNTKEGDFKSIDGDVVQKDFMEQADFFRYYEDADGKLVILPMQGDVDVIFMLGDIEDVCDRIVDCESDNVHIKLPKFETEASFDNSELTEFMKSRGAGIAFSPEADFSAMISDSEVFISDIIQKTKIKVDEEGIEATAASMIAVLGAAPPGEKIETREFIADEPFKYYIVTDDDDPKILFYGQIVK
ncbi:serpin family protein [Butyrivibrio sp. INlla16]|uniref:serpin family protein n=1 Tax=Butyrivibrio sp. INlla16 TaxID=1520807 RepID=UPI000883FECE|nr:serpin family protein [Butyrivibrio sp. INlla16]SDB58001.1 serpin B [Butyrivibrio sp. INlla16]